jgi:hypothetical protein
MTMKELVKKTYLPPSLRDMTIGQLLENCDEFSMKGNTLTMCKFVDGGELTLTFTQQDCLKIVDKVRSQREYSKEEYHDFIVELQETGMTQQRIAHVLGISQAYVSKLAKLEKSE